MTRLYPSKLAKKTYLDFSMRIFPAKLKWLIRRYGIGAPVLSQQGCEHKGKLLAAYGAFISRQRITEQNKDCGYTYIDQMYRRCKIDEFGMVDFDKISFDIKEGLIKETKMQRLIQLQEEQCRERDGETLSMHELVFFRDITNKYFPAKQETHSDLTLFMQYAVDLRNLGKAQKPSNQMKANCIQYKERADPKGADLNIEDAEIEVVESNDIREPPKKKQKVSKAKRGKKFIDNNSKNKNKRSKEQSSDDEDYDDSDSDYSDY